MLGSALLPGMSDDPMSCQGVDNVECNLMSGWYTATGRSGSYDAAKGDTASPMADARHCRGRPRRMLLGTTMGTSTSTC